MTAKEVVLPEVFGGLDPMLRRLSGLFEVPFKTVGVPSTDIWTEESNFFVQMQLQNFDQSDVTVSVENGALVVQAHHQESEKDKKKKYVVRETSDSFYRLVRLPEFADAGKITAAFDGGVLTVTVPLASTPNSTKIPITTGSHK